MWLRLYPETVWDRKLRRHPVAFRWVWITLLCLASDSPERGRLLMSGGLPLTVTDIADAASLPEEEVGKAIDAFLEQGMLAEDDGALLILKWGERQYEDSSAERTRRYRERKKKQDPVTPPSPVTSPSRHSHVTGDVTVTPPDNRLQNSDQLLTSFVTLGSPDGRPPDRASSESRIPPCPHKRIVEAWNEIVAPAGFPRVKDLTANRKRWMTREWARQREKLKTLDDFRAFFTYLAKGCSKALSSGRWFSFDWLFEKAENFSKALEGNYSDRRGDQ